MHSTFTDVAGLQGTTSLCCGVQGILGREGEHMFCIDVTWTSTFSCLFIYYHVLWISYMSLICCGRAATFALWRVTAKVATCESSALMSLSYFLSATTLSPTNFFAAWNVIDCYAWSLQFLARLSSNVHVRMSLLCKHSALSEGTKLSNSSGILRDARYFSLIAGLTWLGKHTANISLKR